jgi:hypothetical protein
MSTLKSVGNKLFKTDLATQKVNLSLVDDAKKLSDEYYTKTDTLNSNIKGLSAEAKAIFDKIEYIENVASKMPKVADGINKMAKDLGIGIENVPEYNSLNLAIKEVKKYSDLKNKIKALF